MARITPDDGLVAVTLSHPLSKTGVEALNLQGHPSITEDGGIPLLTVLRLTRDQAKALMEAGYTTLDPENPAEVAKIVGTVEAAPAVPAQGKPSSGS